MTDKMLIDASHKEETRVVVTRGNRIEEFDFESEHKKQLKGNIYLARVTRVEPSLQAAFVEYGGNRHGFLAFSEIHPDYYQIPVADRQALVEAEVQASALEHEYEVKEEREASTIPTSKEDDAHEEEENNEIDNIESIGAEDVLEEVAHYAPDYRRSYKIQEVIKRRQILLVQVVKEERGNKGAALTTYLSLAGRYSVLMPNTARGGGISRKITNISDRKRLKEVVADLEIPKGMGIILRTAGANRSKAEIRRDYEYLMRLWENVRNMTLSSIAPALVYEEGSLIKRSIRDLYNKDIGEVMVAGEEGYREAKDFMRMLMPSHAKVVQPYRDGIPIFVRNGIEAQLDRMLQPKVSLKSGGYLVINQTEALVAIDVNSGRATKEHSVEETALQTNLEAADEIARQLRLRDLAGLVVIDFIDMEERRHIRTVEKKLKDCLKGDRARIQVGHISPFGLLEMSRQRLRASVLESTTQICSHCNGTGYVRSPSSLALHVVRTIEEYLLRNRGYNIIVRTPTQTALYVLNHKRQMLVDFETRFGVTISVEADNALGVQHLVIDKADAAIAVPTITDSLLSSTEIEEEDIEIQVAPDHDEEAQETQISDNSRRRRHKKRGRERDASETNPHTEASSQNGKPIEESDLFEDRDKKRKSRRRQGRRGRDYEGRARLPWPEPVGAFAASAQATARHLRRARYAPHAEPVGDFFAHMVTGDVTTMETENSSNTVLVANLAPEDAVIQPDIPVKPEEVVVPPTRTRRRNQTTAVQAITSLTIEPEMAQATTPAMPDVQEEIVPVKKTRGRPKKKEMSAQDNDQDIAITADGSSMVEKPKRRRTPKSKVDTPATEVVSSNMKEVDENIDQSSALLDLTENEAEAHQQEPIIISSSLPTQAKPKRMGWWQRKGFF